MKLKQIIYIALLFTASANISFAQWVKDSTYDSHTRKGIDLVYNLEFDKARVEFKELVRLKPDHPAGYFFQAMVEWWQIVIDIDNESHDKKFISMLDNVIDICDGRLDKNDEDITALFFKGGSLGFRGRLYATREDWIKAANDGRQALPIVQDAYKLAPANYDILFGIGVYNYYAEAIPEQYPVVKPLMLFFPDGDKRKGITQLQEASEKATYADIEASYFLVQLLQNYERDPISAMPLAFNLYKRFPNNPLFHRYVGRCQTSLGRWEDMRQTFTEMLRRVQENKTGYSANAEREAQYYLGLYEMHAKKYDDALLHFYRSDELSRTLDKEGASGFMVSTNLKIGNIYDIQTKRSSAIEQYNKVLTMKEYSDSHNEAEKYIRNPYGKF